MKILYGFYLLDSGQITVNEKPVTICSPHDARTLQIGMVFQDFSLIPALSVMENLALFLPQLPAVLDVKGINQRIDQVSERYSLEVNPDALVSQLSVGELQKVEILKLLLAEARLLILDEPTRVLAPHEVEALFQVLDRVGRGGDAILPITHKLRGVETRGQGGEISLKAIDLEVSAGEIVGVAGVSGNGQKELGDVLLGMV